MSRRTPTRAVIVLCAVLVGMSLAVWGCDAEPAPTAGSSITMSGTTATPATTAGSAAKPGLPSFGEA